MANLTVLTLTHNERIHIERCIRNAQRFAQAVFVVDSFSDDGTQQIARSLGAQVFEHTWENHHARQINWALEHLPITTDWVFRLDADEWVTEELVEELNSRLADLPPDVTGVVLRRQLHAFGKRLRWGGQNDIRILRIWRRGEARCEERWMDEHMVLRSGHSVTFEHDFADDNLKPLNWWTTKHASYALREAADTLLAQRGLSRDGLTAPEDAGSRRKRWLKLNVYRRTPRFVRPLAYFSYRYFFRLGLLDGAPGLMWHTLQGFWYRFLVDSILADVQRRAEAERVDELTIIERNYGLKL